MTFQIIVSIVTFASTLLSSVIFFYDVHDNSLLSFEAIFTVVFFIDIVLNFMTPYTDKDGKLVKAYDKIALNYAKMFLPRGLVIDLLSTFPFQLISKHTSLTSATKLLRLFRISRLYALLFNKTLFESIF